MTSECVLVLNAGSSSLKFTVYERLTAEHGRVVARGQIEGIGGSARLTAKDGDANSLADQPLTVGDSSDALEALAEWLRTRLTGARVLGVGHRVVHGGPKYREPTIITPQVLEDLHAFEPLAPLHQPHNLAPIHAVHQRLPDTPQIACFDTSFHRTQPQVAQLVPLPSEIIGAEVQRYGFHGLSYEYIASVLPRVAPHVADARVIVAHLGSGASLCALKSRQSVDSTLGFTALDGLCMGTRPGSIDPGVVLYLFQHLGMTVAEVETLLYRKSGLLGISRLSNDMRDLLTSGEPAAQLAIDYFVYRCAQQIGAMAASLGGVDALVFTAGIGEHSAEIRKRICHASRWLGVELDAKLNDRGAPCISCAGSRVSAWVIPTNEELMIGLHTASRLGLFQ